MWEALSSCKVFSISKCTGDFQSPYGHLITQLFLPRFFGYSAVCSTCYPSGGHNIKVFDKLPLISREMLLALGEFEWGQIKMCLSSSIYQGTTRQFKWPFFFFPEWDFEKKFCSVCSHLYQESRLLFLKTTIVLRSGIWDWDKLKCHKALHSYIIKPFFFTKCFLVCCKPFVKFQSSENIDSDNFLPVFHSFL